MAALTDDAAGRFLPLDRDENGRPLEVGGATTHGAHAQALLESPAAVLAAQDLRERLERDRGGADALSEVKRLAVGHLAEAELVLSHLGNDIARKGLMTPGGRMRPAFGAWCQALDRWQRLAGLVGLERVTKDATPTIEAWLTSIESTAQDGAGTAQASVDDAQHGPPHDAPGGRA